MLDKILMLIEKYGMNFVNGLGTTLLLALISVAVGCVIGAFVAIMRLSKFKPLNWIATVYTEIVRDTRFCSSCISSTSCCRTSCPRSSSASSRASPWP